MSRKRKSEGGAQGEKTVVRSVVLTQDLDRLLQEGVGANPELNLSSLVRAVLREHLGAFLRRKAGEADEGDVALADPTLRGLVHQAARQLGVPAESIVAQLVGSSFFDWLEQALERKERLRRVRERLLEMSRPQTPDGEAAAPPPT
jgi:hypothetical protein